MFWQICPPDSRDILVFFLGRTLDLVSGGLWPSPAGACAVSAPCLFFSLRIAKPSQQAFDVEFDDVPVSDRRQQATLGGLRCSMQHDGAVSGPARPAVGDPDNGSGILSAPGPAWAACSRSPAGTEPLSLPNGETRTFL